MGAPEWNCTVCRDYIFISNTQYPPFECPNCGAKDSWNFQPDEYLEPITHNED